MNTTKLMTIPCALITGSLLSADALASSPNPYMKSDDTWLSISGTVESVEPDSFILDYGDGVVTVEMDDGDRDADGYKLLEGDKVTVNGMIDDDFYELTSIEASSVYVEKLDTYFYASPVDEEDYIDYTVWYTVPVVPGTALVQGRVSEVEDEEFIVNTGFKSVTVDVDDMAYNPLDDKGYQKIDEGDFVRVTGDMDSGLLEDRKLQAESVVVLADRQ